MNITQGNIFWEKDMKIEYNYPYITKDETCDILIIGGGITGAISAYYQAKQGHKVILVEKNLIGFSSTLENSGIIISKLDSAVCSKKASKEIDKINTMLSNIKYELIDIIDEVNNYSKGKVKYGNCKYIKYADKAITKFSISKLYEEEINKDKNIQYIEENDILDIYCGIEYPYAGIVINPYVFNQELVHYLSSMDNVKVFENTYVESINSMEDTVEAVTSNRFKIFASKVILATGISTTKYLKDEVLESYRTYNLVAKMKNKKSKEIFVAKDFVEGKTLRVVEDNIIINGEDVKLNINNSNAYDEKVAYGKYKKLYNQVIKSIADNDIKVKNCFYGIYLQTKDRLPIIDEIEQMPNVYCNLSVGKSGMLYSVLGAKMLQNIYNDCYTKDMYMFRINR